jgi:hypothetical protein
MTAMQVQHDHALGRAKRRRAVLVSHRPRAEQLRQRESDPEQAANSQYFAPRQLPRPEIPGARLRRRRRTAHRCHSARGLPESSFHYRSLNPLAQFHGAREESVTAVRIAYEAEFVATDKAGAVRLSRGD